jgi:hypothetical protein
MTQNAIGSALRRALLEDDLQYDADATVRAGTDKHGAMGVRSLLAAEKSRSPVERRREPDAHFQQDGHAP